MLQTSKLLVILASPSFVQWPNAKPDELQRSSRMELLLVSSTKKKASQLKAFQISHTASASAYC